MSVGPLIQQHLAELEMLWRTKHEISTGLPARSDFSHLDLRPWMGNLLIYDIEYDTGTNEPLRLRSRLIGTNIVDHDGRDNTGKYLDQIIPVNQYAEVLEPYLDAIAERQPTMRTENVKDHSGLIRNKGKIVLPLADDGQTINKFLVGLYFERLISFGNSGPPYVGKNQLEQILKNWRRGVRRRSAFQAMIFDPTKDLASQPQRGFPCLQQLTIVPDFHRETLALNAFYATQQLFEKAYGNFLGLARLGTFIAGQTGLEMERVTCFVGIEKMDRRPHKQQLFVLRNQVGCLLKDF